MPRGYPKKLTPIDLELRKEKKSRFYRIWLGILQRCNNPKSTGWYLYGAKGKKVLWIDYEQFKRDMFDSYNKHVDEFGEIDTTIDRIDGKGHYCKENCRWATRFEQTQNRDENYPHNGGPKSRWCSRKRISKL